MPKDRLLELTNNSNVVEIRSGLGNGVYANHSSVQDDHKSKKKATKKMRSSQKTMDEIFKEIQQMRVWLEAIEEETKLVKRLHTNIEHSAIPEPETKDKLMNAMIKIKTLALRIRNGLKVLEHQKEDKTAEVEVRMISVQHSTLSRRFQIAMIDYQGALAHHKDQTEAMIKAHLRLVIQTVMRRPAVLAGTGTQTPEEIEALLDNESAQVFVSNYVQETQATKLALQDARLRHREMLELEKSIMELHELFTDIATLVHTQGEKINTIEYNTDHGTTQVNLGNQEMAQAYTKKQSARRKKRWCLVLLLCIVAILLVFAALHSFISSLFTF